MSSISANLTSYLAVLNSTDYATLWPMCAVLDGLEPEAEWCDTPGTEFEKSILL